MSEALKFCRACGAVLEPGSAFCSACGQAVNPVPQAILPSAPVSAANPHPAPAPMQPPLLAAPHPPHGVSPPAQTMQAAATSSARRNPGWGMFVIGLLAGTVLTAVGMIILGYMLPMRNMLNVIHDTPDSAQYVPYSSSSESSGTRPTLIPDAAGAAPDASPQGASGPVTIDYDRHDARQVMAYLVYAIFENQPELLGELVGPMGCVFAPYATAVEVPGERNAEEVISQTRQALVDSDATCLGYYVVENGQPDKATIYWLGLNYDWAGLGLSDYAASTVAYEFFLGDDGWELSFISPVPDDLAPGGDELQPVPLDFMPAGE